MTMFMIFIRWIDGIDSGQKTESKFEFLVCVSLMWTWTWLLILGPK